MSEDNAEWVTIRLESKVHCRYDDLKNIPHGELGTLAIALHLRLYVLCAGLVNRAC